ncbi:MAG: 50S ribosomal protein L11 methyltransferase [Clostridia bacterium]|nr:50S ribosomal protein L11 methyltransferase [Clostridia bacterium]
MKEPKKWVQLKVTCNARDTDLVSGVMSMVDNGLMIEDYSDVESIINGVYGELIDESILNADRSVASVSVFVPLVKSPAESEAFIRKQLDETGIRYTVEHIGVSEEDWADSWKQYYKPIKTGKRLVIVPLWESYKPKDGETVVLMDPGMAFGTGTHETTRLCASLLESYISPGCKVLDVGCGSGILAISASKLGAGSCFACDIDPVAVKVARENADINSTPNVTCAVSDLLKHVPAAEGGYDVVVANIVADIIIRMSPDVGRFMSENGILIVSGIIDVRAAEVTDVLRSDGFIVETERYENGWYAAALKKGRCSQKEK